MSELAVSGSLNDNQTAKACEDAKAIYIRQTVSSQAPVDFVTTVRNSALFQQDWSGLLSAAPMSISLLGTTMIAASSDVARDTPLVPPKDGFKHLSFKQLRPNLLQVVDMGATAFRLAHKNMDSISLRSKQMDTTINQIMLDLSGTPQDAKLGLNNHMDILKLGASDCKSMALEMDKKFQEWLEFVNELHQSAEETSGDATSRQSANETALLAQNAMLNQTQSQQETAKKSLDTLQTSVETAREAFDKASRNIPSGWDLIGMQFVSGLCNTLLTGANNYMQQKTGNTQQSTGSGGDKSQQTQAQTMPNDFDDPAYAQIRVYGEVIGSLRSTVVGGDDGGVDWDSAVSNKSDGKGNFSYIKEMLTYAQSTFTPSGQTASTTYDSILRESLQLVNDLVHAAAGHNTLNWVKPDPKGEQVAAWQQKASSIYSRSCALSATARSIPGATTGQVPLVKGANAAAQTPSGGSVTEQILASASSTLQETHAAFDSAQDTYQKASDKLIDVQKNLGNIKAELAKLGSDKVKIEHVKAVLIKCIESIIPLKIQIGKLVQFFDAMATLVEFATTYQVDPFLKYLDKLIAGTITQATAIGKFQFSDLQRQFVYQSTLMIRAYYSLFRSITQMYLPTSQKCILPGCDLLLLMSGVSDDTAALQKKKADLDKFTSDATDEVLRIVKESQDKILDGLQNRVTEIAADTKILPAPTADTAKAITEGASSVTQAISQGIEAFEPLSSRPLTVSFGDD